MHFAMPGDSADPGAPGGPAAAQRAAAQPAAAQPIASAQQPVALLYGRGRLIVHANPAFVAEFGATCLGLPAREAVLPFPRRVFEVVDRAWASGRPLATSVVVDGIRRRLTVAPRTDIETGEVYGVAIRLASEVPRPTG